MPEIRKIVVLEDDRTTCALIASVLEKAGYEVFQANEGRTAVEMVFKERPSLLISDVLVPDMNGSEVVKSLNKSSFGAQLEKLFLTSLLNKGEAEIVERKLKVEGKEYPALAKPLKPDLLIEIVTRLAGDPIATDAVKEAVEESVEAQENEANKAIEAEDDVEASATEEEEGAPESGEVKPAEARSE